MAESMQGLHRTCRCAEVTKEMIGKEVVLMGWVQKARDKGGIIFVDLRDRSGIMQLIFENGSIDEEGFAKAGKLRSEFVIAVTGVVEERGGAVNKNLATGEIELRVDLRSLFIHPENKHEYFDVVFQTGQYQHERLMEKSLPEDKLPAEGYILSGDMRENVVINLPVKDRSLLAELVRKFGWACM